METIVLLAQDCPKDGWRKSCVPRVFAWQEDGYSYGSHLRKTNSDLSEQMHAIGGFYLPADMLPCGSHIGAEKHFSFAIESGPSSYNNIQYPTAPTWHHSAASQVNHQSRDIHWGVQGCRSGSTLRAQTFTKTRSYEFMGQVFCRYSSSCLVSGKSLEEVFPKRDELPVRRTAPLARTSSLTHALQQPKTSKRSTNRASAGVKERSSPATQKFSSCKDSDVYARRGFDMEDEVHLMSFEPMHNRLANKAPQSVERVDCNIPRTASPKPYQILTVRANCIKKDGKESLASINDAPLDRIVEGREGECSSMNTSEAKAIMRHSSPSSKRDIYEDHCDGLIPSDPVLTSALITPLAIKGSSRGVAQSGHSMATNERWAGPAFSNSPPPSSLPVPTFTRRQPRISSLEMPRAQAEFLADSICVSAPGTCQM